MSVVTVAATVEAGNVPPRVRLDVTDTGTPALFATTVTRLNPDGSVVPVRTQDGNPLVLTTSGSNRVGLIYDYEAPMGEIVSYSTEETPTSSSVSVTVPAAQIWLIHPGIPALSMPIDLLPGSLMDEAYPAKQGVFKVMGRSTPVVQTDGTRASAQSTLVVLTEDFTELAGLNALIADAGTLLLNIPAPLGMGFDSCYISIQDVKISRLTDVNADVNRSVTLPFTVVAMPIGGSQSQRTYTDLLSFATYADLKRHFATYADVLAGP